MDDKGSGIFHFLKIQSDDPRIVRQSRLVQILVGLILLGSLRGIITALSDLISGQPTLPEIFVFAGQFGSVFLFAVFTLYLLHKGRFLIALNLSFIILNLILFSLLISTDGAGPFELLLLISVFSVAALQSIRVSAIYLIVIVAAVSFYYINNRPDGTNDAISFIQIALLLTAPSWFFANDLRNSRDRAKHLSNELEATVTNLDKRANQLEQIAEVGRVATASLDQEKLIQNAVGLIQAKFGFYYVSLHLMTPNGSRLILQAASGETGDLDKQKGDHTTVGQVSVVGWVAINRRARIALDTGHNPYLFDNPNLPETHSEIALPLMARGRLLGVLDVQSKEKNAFHAEDIPVFQVMADQIAAGIDNARLFEDITEQANQLTELQSITSLMSQQRNIQNAMNVIVERVTKLFNVDGGGIFLYQAENEHLELIQNLNINDTHPGGTLKPGEGLTGRAFATNKSMTVEDYSHWEGRSENYVTARFVSAVAIPLRRQTESFGVMTFTRSWQGQPFQVDEIQFAELLAAQVSAVILNNQLIDETRRLIKRERNINQAATQIRRSLDARTILDTTTDELGNLLGNRVIKARLYSQAESLEEEIETS